MNTFIVVLYYNEYDLLEQDIRDTIINRLEKWVHWYGYYLTKTLW